MSAITTFHKDLIVMDHATLDGMSQGDLVELAKDINGKAIKAAKQTLIHAGQTGIVLIALKEKVPHGQFLKYVESLTEIPARTAQTYMSIAVNYATVAHLRGVRDAIRYIRESSGRANRITESESVTLAHAPRPASTVIMDAELVEPETVVVDGTKQESAEAIETQYYDESAVRLAAEHGVTPAEVVRAGIYAEAVEALPVAADFDAKNFYGIINVMIPHLTQNEIRSLIETLKNSLK